MEEGGWKSEEGAMLEGGGVGWNAETIWERFHIKHQGCSADPFLGRGAVKYTEDL